MVRNTHLFGLMQARSIVVFMVIACMIPCCATNQAMDTPQEQVIEGVSEGNDVNNNGMVLPSPSELIRCLSYIDADRIHPGSAFDDQLPYNRIAPYGNDAILFPQWSDTTSRDSEGLAYGIYAFSLVDYDKEAEIWYSWDQEPEHQTLWLGISYFTGNHWEWHTDITGHLALDGMDDYIDELSGGCFIAVVLVGTDTCRLNWLRVGSNTPPKAVVTAAPVSGLAPLDVNLDASGSSDLDGEIIKYEWDWDGDGTYDHDSGADATTQHTYSANGTYTVTVRITDNLGATSTGSVAATTIKVNAAPQASLVVTPAVGETPLKVQFDTTGTQDSDGTIESFDWDWDGDGIYEVIGGGSNPWHTYTSTGQYQPVVRVIDNDGASSTAIVEVKAVEWIVKVVDDAIGSGPFTSIAIDSNDEPCISYYDNYLGDLKFASHQTGSWVITPVDEPGNVGLNTSLALDSADHPHIGYFDDDRGVVKYAYNDGNIWHSGDVTTIAVSGDGGICVDLDSNEDAHFAYHRNDGAFDWLTYAYPDGIGGFDYWSFGTSDTGITLSMEIGTGDIPHFSTYDANGDWLFYIHDYGPAASSEIVDSDGNVGFYSSIELDSDGNPHIAYKDMVRNDLYYAYSDGSEWHIETACSEVRNAGNMSCLALDDDDKAHIVHLEQVEENLLYTTNRRGYWETKMVDGTTGAGWYPGIALDSHSLPHISYHVSGVQELRHAYLGV